MPHDDFESLIEDHLDDAEPEIIRENIFDLADDDASGEFNIRDEIRAQVLLLKAIRTHIFHIDGQPKVDTEPQDITAYMNSSMRLLSMLQSFESSLKTDADLRRIELAIEMAMEDSPCPGFVAALTGYLEGDLI